MLNSVGHFNGVFTLWLK